MLITSTIDTSGDHIVDDARSYDENGSTYVIGAVLQALAFLLLAPVLTYLHRVTAYRWEQIPPWARHLAIGGAVLMAIGTIGSSFTTLAAYDDVLARPVSQEAGEDLFADGQTEGLGIVFIVAGFAARIALAFALISISNAARKSGVLSNFLGITGIIVGVFLVIPFGPLPIVQWFWLGAVALILLERWPSGRGPAWETGEAEPWPSAAQMRAEAAAEGAEAPDEPEYEDEEYDDEAEPDEPGGEPARPQHPKSKKRKRKRRR